MHTYLHVREDALQLYGFAERAERELFVQLLSVNGIGPKVALAIVSGSPAAELRRAIVLEDTARFQAIPGIGKKTAERIVLELKEKLGDAPCADRVRRPATHAASRRARRARRARLLRRRGGARARARSIRSSRRRSACAKALKRLPEPSSQFLAPAVRPRGGGARAVAASAPADEFVGQERIKEQLAIALDGGEGARARRSTTSCWSGPPGLGKTSLAYIVREELGVGIRCVAGPALERKGDMAAILTGLERARRPLRRRDPPAEPRDRGDPLSRRSRTSGSTSSSGRARRRAR